MQLVKVLSSSYDKAKKRLIKLTRFGKSDTQTAMEAMPFGLDSNPIKDMIAVYAATSETGKEVIIGYLNKNQLADAGELRLFSTDATGSLKANVWLKKDGTIELNGNSLGGLTKTIELQTQLYKMQAQLDACVTSLRDWTVASGDGGLALKQFFAAQIAGRPRSNFDNIENTKVKQG